MSPAVQPTWIDLPFPFGGVSDAVASVEQPPKTTRDAVNVRGKDPISGRIRGAQRSGLTKAVNTRINGPNKVQLAASITYDNRKATYAGITPAVADTTWTNVTPTKSDCPGVVCDSQGNVYAIDGRAGVAKYNSAGTLQWRVALPLQDELHVCRAIAVDEGANVYVGVSAGGDQTKARLLKITQGLDSKVYVNDTNQGAWVLDIDGYVEDMKYRNGLLVLAMNFPDRFRAFIRAYSSLGAAVPVLAWQSPRVSYPLNSIAIKTNDEIVFSSEPFASRGFDPRFPSNTQVTVDWAPSLLTDWKKRVWTWFDAETLDLEEDEPVTIWPDLSGGERHLTGPVDANLVPTFNKEGLAGKPTVRWSGAGAGGVPQALSSGPNPSTASDFSDQQKTLLPAWTGATDAEKAMFALFVVFRPEISADGSAPPIGSIRCMVSQPQARDSISGTNCRKIIVNRAASGTLPGTAAAGQVNVYETGATGTAGPGTTQVLGATISTLNIQAGILTLICDGGRSTLESVFRFNGTGIDRFNSAAHGTLLNTLIGISHSGDTTLSPYAGEIAEILVLRDLSTATDGILGHPYAPDGGGDTSGDSECERIEGYLAHKWGIAHILPVGHPFYLTKGPPRAAGVATESLPFLLNSVNGICGKLGAANRDLKWVVTGRLAAGSFPAVAAAGVGYGVTVDADGNVYTTGPLSTGATAPVDNSIVRKIIDNGTSATISGAVAGTNSATPSSPTGAWSKTSNDLAGTGTVQSWTYKTPRLASDTFSNLYLPWHLTTLVTYPASLAVWDKTGAFHLTGVNDYRTSFNSPGLAVVPDPVVPDYASDFAGGSALQTARAEFANLGTTNDANVAHPSVHQVKFATATANTGSARSVTNLAIAGGALKKWTSGSVTDPAGAGTLASPQFSTTSQRFAATVHSGQLFFTDTVKAFVYDPKTDTLKEWKSRTAGKLPQRFMLMETWRGRVVLARFQDDPHLWFMLAQGDPYDADTAPPVVTPVQAIEGSLAKAGLPSDIINSVYAFNDDFLFIGGDHSIALLRGDPMAGGEIDLVSDEIGTAFGPVWAKSPEGQVFFFSSRGGVYSVAPGGTPQSISHQPGIGRSIEKRLQAVNLSTYYVQLLWNTKDDGLHVLFLPYGNSPTGTQVQGWFWERATNAWWPDEYGYLSNQTVQPTAAIVLDGDLPNDRRLVFGCEDGYMRLWDELALSDDGLIVDARATIGPLVGKEADSQVRYMDPEIVLANDQQGARVHFFGADVPDVPGLPVQSFTVQPGLNLPSFRLTAGYVWMQIRGALAGSRFAFEHAKIQAVSAGRKRVGV